MTAWLVILWALLLPAAAVAVASVGPHFWTRADRGGDKDKGLVIFVEPVRWLSVRWGMRPAAAGLRDAGFEGEFLYWRWHATWRGWLVLPAIMDRAMLERQARKLAEFIADRRREHPDGPIFLIGYSCGGYVAVRAMELLPDGLRVHAAATLAGVFAPSRDLAPACDRVRGKLVVCSSFLDCLIAGLGTLVFGTADRKHVLSAGMVGVRKRANEDPRIVQVRWRPSMIRSGHWGGHFSAAARGFIRRYVAPQLGIGQK